MRKKWWIFGPRCSRGTHFVGVNLITRNTSRSAHSHRRPRERLLPAGSRQGASERDRTVDQEAVTSQVQLALSRDLARQ